MNTPYKPNAWPRNNQFKSKQDGIDRAKKSHACLDCRHIQTKIYKTCPRCGSKRRQYFMSEAELKRGMTLLTLQMAGTISNLRFQPKYDLKVNGRKVTRYVADADYMENGALVVEDTKPKNFMTDAAKIKLALFEAIYNIEVRIPQRSSGNRH